MVSLITQLYEWFCSEKSSAVKTLVLCAVLGWQTYQLNEIASHTHVGMTNYPMAVIEYGFADVDETKEKIELVRQWHRDKWGAQIGALRTVCAEKPNRLEEILDKDTVKVICVIANR